MTAHTSGPTGCCSAEPALIGLPGGWDQGSLLARRAAARLPLSVLDLVDALTARRRVGLEGAARMPTRVVTAGGAAAVGADPGAPPGKDAHAATVASGCEMSSAPRELCHAVVLRVAWTSGSPARRTVPGAEEVAGALDVRLHRAAA